MSKWLKHRQSVKYAENRLNTHAGTGNPRRAAKHVNNDYAGDLSQVKVEPATTAAKATHQPASHQSIAAVTAEWLHIAATNKVAAEC